MSPKTLTPSILIAPIVLMFGVSLRAADRPNVVLIMTDNHGAWTLGCYGNRDIRTPHIDRLAAGGALFTRAFSSNPVCSPTRATFLTGLMPSQHGVHCFLSGGRLQIGPDARCTLDRLTSLPEVLRDAGYSCGLVGKWHLGDNLRPQEGFDDYWITMPHGGTSAFYDAQIIENGKLRREPEYLTDFWTRHALRFIDQSAQRDKPFFLFLSYNGPYSLGRLLLREGRNRHAAYYADKPLPSFPRETPHPWQYNNRDYQNNPVSLRRVATEVSGVDDGVGAVMNALRERGLDENTLVVFVADQGWVGGHGGFFGMGDHTRPLTARDGMMRIPMIWNHPKRIDGGIKSDRLVANYDFMPTLLSYLKLGDQQPRQPSSPGEDFSAEFKTKTARPARERELFYEFENLRCIRTAGWKYVRRHPNGPHELYDLNRDPDEFNNLVGAAEQADIAAELNRRLEAFFGTYALPKYDMWKGGGSQTRIFVGVDEESAQTQPAAPPKLSKGFAPAKINAPEGFEVELAAGPPLVTHPTLACFDDRGRLFVCSSAGLNMGAKELEENLPNSIRMLEDRDGDGRFDRATVFADKMTFPMGGTWHEGALYVASPPKIWRLEDTDGDGVADKRDVIVSQFGYTGNAASVHGCFRGPDGRLYWCDGYHGHEFRDDDGAVVSKREGSYIFSCRPDGTDVRIHCGGGMDNPVEVDFTEEGDVLGTVNILFTRPRDDCLVHWQYGGAYPHRERVLNELQVTGPLLGPAHRFGHVAVSGVTRYRSGAIDHRWRDNLFVTFFNSGKIVRLEMARSGSTYRATQREFLSSPSRDFHPTDVLEDADGTLLVVDTGGWFYRGCPTSQLAKPDVQGAIYRIRRKGMTAQVDPWGKRIRWSKLTPGQVARHLNDTRYKVREAAIDECARRGESIIPTLATSIARRDVRERRNAVWALTRIAADSKITSKVRAALRTALKDRDASVRQAACRSVGVNPDEKLLPELHAILQKDVPPVRREAAAAIGRVGDASSVPELLAALSARGDRELEHSIVYALLEIKQPEPTRRGLNSPSAAVQRGALIAIDQLQSGGAAVEDVAPRLSSKDEALRAEAWRIFRVRAKSAKSRTEWAAAGTSRLKKLLDDNALAAEQAAQLRGLAVAFADHAPAAKLIGESLGNSQTPDSVRGAILKALSARRNLPLHESWRGPLERMLHAADAAEIDKALTVVPSLKSHGFGARLKQLAADKKQPALTRVAALEALGGKSTSRSDESFAVLLDLLHQSGGAEAARAASMIGASALTAEQLLALAPELRDAGPLALRDLIRPYQRNTRPHVGAAFLESLGEARSLLSLPTSEVSDIVKRYPTQLRAQANRLLDRLKAFDQQRLAQLDQLIPLLNKGDPARGREVFFSEKSKCATCHRVVDKGGKIGPDLSTIGANRSDRDLLESIVFPSASIVRQYEPYSLRTTGGRVYAGLIVRETKDLVQLQPQTGDPVTVPRDEIEELVPSTVSIMPKGLEQALTKQQLADIIAWLRQLKSVRVASGGQE